MQVQWGDYMTLDSIKEKLEHGRWTWVPDGLQVRKFLIGEACDLTDRYTHR